MFVPAVQPAAFVVQPERAGQSDAGYRIADHLTRLEHAAVQVREDSTTALWLRFRVPAETEAGIYYGEVTLGTPDGQVIGFPLALRVYDVQLAPDDMAVGLRIWQTWGGAARSDFPSIFSDAWWNRITDSLHYLADMQNRVIQVGRAYFDWRFSEDGQWQFDASRFDKYAWICSDFWEGIDVDYVGMVNVAGEDTIFYTDDDDVMEQVLTGPGDRFYDDAWSEFIKALDTHITALDGAFTVWVADRPKMSDVKRVASAMRLVHRVAPDADTAVTVDDTEVLRELAEVLDVAAVPLSRFREFVEVVDETGRSNGIQLWAYPDAATGYPWCIPDTAAELAFMAGYVSQFPPLEGLLLPAYPADEGLHCSLRSERLLIGIEAAQILRQVGVDRPEWDDESPAELVDAVIGERLRALKDIELRDMLE